MTHHGGQVYTLLTGRRLAQDVEAAAALGSAAGFADQSDGSGGRMAISLDARLDTADGYLDGTLVDISYDGARFKGLFARRYRFGEEVQIVIASPGQLHPAAINATIRWSTTDGVYAGMRFASMDLNQLHSLERLYNGWLSYHGRRFSASAPCTVQIEGSLSSWSGRIRTVSAEATTVVCPHAGRPAVDQRVELRAGLYAVQGLITETRTPSLELRLDGWGRDFFVQNVLSAGVEDKAS